MSRGVSEVAPRTRASDCEWPAIRACARTQRAGAIKFEKLCRRSELGLIDSCWLAAFREGALVG